MLAFKWLCRGGRVRHLSSPPRSACGGLVSSAGASPLAVSFRSPFAGLNGARRLISRGEGFIQDLQNRSPVYNPSTIEAKWQRIWDEVEVEKGEHHSKLGGKYILSMFPYPSGHLHMGHARVYTISDALARVNQMRGYDVLHPMGWDAFGLPAENAAIERGVQPSDWTVQNISVMKEQLRAMGHRFDWDRELATCHPSYYRWTQWLFLQLHKRGLAYQKEATVNWDPIDQTVLANEQVDAEGRSWRSGAVVEQKDLKQWFFRITQFADELEADLDKLEQWPEEVRLMQKNWIGKSKGTAVQFELAPSGCETTSAQEKPIRLDVFTTRVDTLMGVSFLAMAPDHPVLEELFARNVLNQDSDKQEIVRFRELVAEIAAAEAKNGPIETPEKDRALEGLQLPNVEAIHPITGDRVPVFLTNYVVADYATGAVMGVPAHDTRDMRFAKRFNLPVQQVIAPALAAQKKKKGSAKNQKQADESTPVESEPTVLEEAIVEDGVLVNSGVYSNLTSKQARKKITGDLHHASKAEPYTLYRLRDWLVSRQRFWGTPIPMINCDSCGSVPVPEDDLPVELPSNIQLTGRGKSPLASDAAAEWRAVSCPSCGADAQRDTDTLDTFIDSSWYFLRFLDPSNEEVIFPREIAESHMPVSSYIGGIEHAILHLLYARFITRFLHAEGLSPTPEPFESLTTQGMVQAETFRNPSNGRYIPPSEVEWKGSDRVHRESGTKLQVTYEKMSKSKYNGIDPQEIMNTFGADVIRVFILFKAPVSQALDWDDKAVFGPQRWLARVWDHTMAHIEEVSSSSCNTLKTSEGGVDAAASLIASRLVSGFGDIDMDSFEVMDKPDKELLRDMHHSIVEITKNMETTSLNVYIANLMKLSNSLGASKASLPVRHECLKVLLKMMAPATPHISSELWVKLAQLQDSVSGVIPLSMESIETALPASYNVHQQEWPVGNETIATSVDSVTVVIQVKGKKKGTIEVDAKELQAVDEEGKAAVDAFLIKAVSASPAYERAVGDKTVRKTIVVRNQKMTLVNLVL